MIQDKDPSFYASFNVILSGLDNVEARRWLNATVVGLVEVDDDGDPTDPESIVLQLKSALEELCPTLVLMQEKRVERFLLPEA